MTTSSRLLLLALFLSVPKRVGAFLHRGDVPIDFFTKHKTTKTTNLRPKVVVVTNPPSSTIDDSTQKIVADGVIDLGFNPAYLHYADFDDYGPALVVSSFFNVARNPAFGAATDDNNTGVGGPPYFPFERDLVALIDLDDQRDDLLQAHNVLELTDVGANFPNFRTVWPNIARRAPDGVFPFEAILVPQGWFATMPPGRLVAIDVATLEEHVIHQSTPEAPRFYHDVAFVDMDRDGYLDIVTTRSSFKVVPTLSPPAGELVWFRNPGPDQEAEWEEHVLYQGVDGPDVALDVYDLEGDGVPEIIATQFFAGLSQFENSPWWAPSRLTLFGAPVNHTWADVNQSDPVLSMRVADIVTDQGKIFNCEFVDLNRDGRMDVLVTNHQGPEDVDIPGRVLALEQPASGRIFDDDWVTHILLDNIQTAPGPGTERMAPGSAKSFQPIMGGNERPWIVVSGDEAGKVWVLAPVSNNSDDWDYDSHVIFDINEFYGEGTTHTPLKDPFGITVSTVGEIAVHEQPNGAVLYVPVFEATDVHVFRLNVTLDDFDDDFDDDSDDDASLTFRAAGRWVYVVALGLTLMLA